MRDLGANDMWMNNYRCSQTLTEQEQKYLEHFWFKKGSQVAGITRFLIFITLFFMIVFVVIVWVNGLENIKATLMILLGFGGMLAMTYGAMIIRTNWDKKRYAPILNGNYEVLRTKIKLIDYHDIGTTRGGHMRIQ